METPLQSAIQHACGPDSFTTNQTYIDLICTCDGLVLYLTMLKNKFAFGKMLNLGKLANTMDRALKGCTWEGTKKKFPVFSDFPGTSNISLVMMEWVASRTRKMFNRLRQRRAGAWGLWCGGNYINGYIWKAARLVYWDAPAQWRSKHLMD